MILRRCLEEWKSTLFLDRYSKPSYTKPERAMGACFITDELVTPSELISLSCSSRLNRQVLENSSCKMTNCPKIVNKPKFPPPLSLSLCFSPHFIWHLVTSHYQAATLLDSGWPLKHKSGHPIAVYSEMRWIFKTYKLFHTISVQSYWNKNVVTVCSSL